MIEGSINSKTTNFGLYFLKSRPLRTFNSKPSTSMEIKSISKSLNLLSDIMSFKVFVWTFLTSFAFSPDSFDNVFKADLL